jgi:6-phosphofructokinase 1
MAAQKRFGWEVVGIREGFDGLLAGLPTLALNEATIRDLLPRGGTILGAANRGSPFARRVEKPDGTVEHIDVSHEALERLDELKIEALVVAGGDGTMAIANRLVRKGAKIVGVPKTIDNDLNLTDVTFGFDTAINTATEALDKLQTTAESHHRAMVLEVMGRHAGWIALKAGVAGGADAILIPEIPFDIDVVCNKIKDLQASGRRYSLIVVAEGAHPAGGRQEYYIGDSGMMNARLGGVGYSVGNALYDCLGVEVRVTVLGHLQRGGQPTPHDRWLATRFGWAAVHAVAEEKWGHMIAMRGERIVTVPIENVSNIKRVDTNGDLVMMARDLGIVFG